MAPAALLVFASAPVLLVAVGLLWASRPRDPRGDGAGKTPGPTAAPASAGTLSITAGMRAGETIDVTDPIVVGRDPDRANLVLPDPAQVVSGAHCEIGFDPARQRFAVRDLGSRNGTFAVAGNKGPRRRVAGETEMMAPGTELELGSNANRIRLELAT